MPICECHFSLVFNYSGKLLTSKRSQLKICIKFLDMKYGKALAMPVGKEVAHSMTQGLPKFVIVANTVYTQTSLGLWLTVSISPKLFTLYYLFGLGL